MKRYIPTRSKCGLMPQASRLLLYTLPVLLGVLCEHAARLYALASGGAVGIHLQLGAELEYACAAFAIVTAGALLLDISERKDQ